jgi:hypothetical protein
MAIGCDLIGSKTSLAADRSTDLKLSEVGVLAISKSSDRQILIPFSNIKGIELIDEQMKMEMKKK